jgi:phosphopentomutase
MSTVASPATTTDASTIRRIVVLVADSLGVGEAPDAGEYGDQGSDTLGNIARHVGGLTLPYLQELGLGHLETVLGVPPVARPRGAFGKMQELSSGKDTTTGHWEMMGIVTREPLRTFANGFPDELLGPWKKAIGRDVLGNKPASGTEIIKELGAEHVRTGKPIVYTSADSVFQVAAHEDVIPVPELYRICEEARRLCDRFMIGRVIARPFVGEAGAWKRTYNRKDFSMLPPTETVLDRLVAAGVPVVGVGKIPDIFADRGVTEKVHTEGNADGLERTVEILGRMERGLLFVNLVDFDMVYGHRNDAKGYAGALAELDAFLPRLQAALRPGDLVMLTADHGNDPTTPSTDHSREYVPILAWGPARAAGVDLGVRQGFCDLGATVAQAFGVAGPAGARSFLDQVS